VWPCFLLQEIASRNIINGQARYLRISQGNGEQQ
jgi:hypothetical protein